MAADDRHAALHLAILQGKLGQVETLAAEVALSRPVGSRLAQPLRVAVMTRRVDIVALLLRLGADPRPDEGAAGGSTLLADAAGRLDDSAPALVDLLVEHGAEVDRTDASGRASSCRWPPRPAGPCGGIGRRFSPAS